MGGRLSRPRGPAGTTESSIPAKAGAPFPRRINSRTIAAPAAAFTMAVILFVYARTSIRAAKANAQRHREADTGGEGLNLLAESRRRHGLAKRIDGEGGGTVMELGRELVGANKKIKADEVNRAVSEEDEKLRALRGKMGRKSARGESSTLR